MTLEQRIERLELENRWMRRIGAAGIGVVTVVMLMGQGEPKELRDLVAKSLTVQDADGKRRATLETTGGGGTRLVIRDQEGVERLSAGLSDHGVARIAMGDAKGEEWMSLSTYAKGGATLIFRNPRLESQLYLAVWEGGETRLSFGRKERAVLDLWDIDGTPSINLVNPAGRSGISMTVMDDGSPSLSVSGADGRVIWQAPGE